MNEIRIIKKYSNRRLYDATTSKSITVEEVKALVLQHVPFKIIDNKTEEDMTNYVLLQIITEGESGRSPIFTTAMLENLIRVYNNPMQKIFSQFLEKSFLMFAEQQNQSPFFTSKNQGLDTIVDFTKRNLELWQSIFSPKNNEKETDNCKHQKRKKST